MNATHTFIALWRLWRFRRFPNQKFIQCCLKGYEIDGASVCYQITLERLKHANVDACLPFYGEKEVSAEAIDSEYFKKYLLAFSL